MGRGGHEPPGRSRPESGAESRQGPTPIFRFEAPGIGHSAEGGGDLWLPEIEWHQKRGKGAGLRSDAAPCAVRGAAERR